MKVPKIFILLIFSLLLISCEKDIDSLSPPMPVHQMEDLEISDSFNWNTSKTIEFKISLDSDNLIQIITQDGLIYHRAKVRRDKEYNVKITLPNYYKYIILKIGNNLVELPIDSNIYYL